MSCWNSFFSGLSARMFFSPSFGSCCSKLFSKFLGKKIIGKSCANIDEEFHVFWIMPKRFLREPPRKKIKLSEERMGKTVKKSHDSGNTTAGEHNLKKSTENPIKRFPEMEKMDSTIDLSGIKVQYLETPVKSENDKKDYRVVKLPNGLTALLISDPSPAPCDDEKDHSAKSLTDDEGEESESGSEDDGSEEGSEEDEDEESESEEHFMDGSGTDGVKKIRREEKMAACGLCIGVGSFSDPPEVPGMAHFLEHMVFMGSKKFPEENDFDAFIRKHGGSDNAYTECEQTTFHFEIQEKYFSPALERFAQFFIEPLMKRDAIAREREAVESEFQMGLQSDMNRKEQLFSSLAKEGHPPAKFVWGNLVTLRDNVTDDKLYEELHKFRKRHYSAHRMTVALQARLPLDTLENYVKQYFADVPCNDLPGTDFEEYKNAVSFDTPNFRRIYKIKPVKDTCQVELTWTMPSLQHLYRSKPNQYVSWIIGHEGKGSLISYLRKKMWCLDIFSGNSETGFEHSTMYALFTLTLVLTDEGHEHLAEVLEAVFSYINMLRRAGPQRRIFDEIQKIEETNFRFADETPQDEYVEDLCENMHFYAPADFINGSDLYFEYNPVEIEKCIESLCTDNVNIIICDKKFDETKFEKLEPWFSSKYTDCEIPSDWVENWRKIEPFPDFHLPEPNIFVTDDFSLIEKPTKIPKYPEQIFHDELSEIWYKADEKFGLPECYVNFFIVSPLPLASPENAVMLDLMVMTLKQLLVEELYPATAAGLSGQINPHARGAVLKASGFNQKLPCLLEAVSRYIANFSRLLTKDLFDVMKKEQTKDYYNKFLKPSRLVDQVRSSILMLRFWSSNEKHAAIADIDFEQMRNFADHFTDHVYVQALVQGNMEKSQAVEITRKCIEILNCRPLLPSTMPEQRVLQIPLGVRCCRVKAFNPTDVNSVVTNYYQCRGASLKLAVIIDLLIMIMEEPLFNRLRTQEQLGYNIYCLMRDTFGIYGYSISVCLQADKYTCEHVDERIEEFVLKFKELLGSLSDEEFRANKEALIKVKMCADIHLKEEVDGHWNEIVNREYIFDRRDREIAEIESLKIDDLRDFLNEHSLGGANLRKLSVQIVGTDCKKQNEDSATNLPSGDTPMIVSNECGTKVAYPLELLVDLPCEKTKKNPDYYVTDIDEFKRSLFVYPIYRSTS